MSFTQKHSLPVSLTSCGYSHCDNSHFDCPKTMTEKLSYQKSLMGAITISDPLVYYIAHGTQIMRLSWREINREVCCDL